MKRHVWHWMIVTLMASTSACSQRDDGAGAGSQERSDRAGPNIAPSSAPGVAFAYRYRFGLADGEITAAQESHAAACEKLGVSKCRITGLSYDLGDHDRVTASLDLTVDAGLARGFGKQAIDQVAHAGGRLLSATITGEDQNPVLETAAAREREAVGAAASIDTSLNETTEKFERSVLRDQSRQARSDVIGAREQAASARARIILTPMHFVYDGGGAGRGFAGENPAREAWYLFIDSLATMIGFALKALAVALPWLVLLSLALFALRSRPGRQVRHWFTGFNNETGQDGDGRASES